jgi:hypothetical protein
MSTKTSRSGGKAQAAGAGKNTKVGRKGRRPVAPVRVGKDRNWGTIAMFAVVGLIAAAIIGFAAYAVLSEDDRGWEEQAADIEGIVNYREQQPEMLSAEHVSGPLSYEVTPPVGGQHNDNWQNCQGMVYDGQIPSEHAVHSLEHGAVWITYRPDLPEEQVEQLAGKVSGNDFLFMSQFEELDAPISLQAWGYQLKVQDAGDSRIDQFIRTLRFNATQESDAGCGGGSTVTGTVPVG